MIDYLNSKNVRIAAVELPYGTWFNNYAPAVEYRQLRSTSAEQAPTVNR